MSVMLAVLVTTVVSPGQSEVLDGISRAFFAALDRDGSGEVIGVWCALVLAATYVVVGWLRGDAQSQQRERRELEARRVRIASEAPPRLERREWARIPANVAIKVAPTSAGPRAPVTELETQDVGGGGLSFLSEEPPRRGTRLSFTLDLGEQRPLAVRGVVCRVDPPRHPGAPSRVAVRFSEISAATRERLIMWIAQRSRLQIIEARRGKLCAGCDRPVADATESMHPTCAARMDVKQAA